MSDYSKELDKILDQLLLDLGFYKDAMVPNEWEGFELAKQAILALIEQAVKEARKNERQKVRVKMRHQLRTKGVDPSIISLARPVLKFKPKTSPREIDYIDKSIAELNHTEVNK